MVGSKTLSATFALALVLIASSWRAVRDEPTHHPPIADPKNALSFGENDADGDWRHFALRGPGAHIFGRLSWKKADGTGSTGPLPSKDDFLSGSQSQACTHPETRHSHFAEATGIFGGYAWGTVSEITPAADAQIRIRLSTEVSFKCDGGEVFKEARELDVTFSILDGTLAVMVEENTTGIEYEAEEHNFRPSVRGGGALAQIAGSGEFKTEAFGFAHVYLLQEAEVTTEGALFVVRANADASIAVKCE